MQQREKMPQEEGIHIITEVAPSGVKTQGLIYSFKACQKKCMAWCDMCPEEPETPTTTAAPTAAPTTTSAPGPGPGGSTCGTTSTGLCQFPYKHSDNTMRSECFLSSGVKKCYTRLQDDYTVR